MLTKKGASILTLITAKQEQKRKAKNAYLKQAAKKWAIRRVSELAKELKSKNPADTICILNPSDTKLTDSEQMQIDAFCDVLGITGLIYKAQYEQKSHIDFTLSLIITVNDLRDLLLAAQQDPNS